MRFFSLTRRLDDERATTASSLYYRHSGGKSLSTDGCLVARLHGGPRIADDLHVLPCQRFDTGEVTASDSVFLDQRTANAEGTGTCLEEGGSRIEIDSTGWHHEHLGQGAS